MTATEDVESGHLDRVTALHINYDGSKLLTASIDHRFKVWNIDRATGERTLIETVSAHDADIRDAKWFHPSTGTHLATIGNDLKCHIWQEDPNQQPNSGRRFRKVCLNPIMSKPRVPFVSLDIKNIDNVYTVLALIDRQGLLSVYEPTNPDEFKDWTLVDQFNVCMPPPGRGEQTCFKVCFDQNVTPLPYMNCLSDDRRQLSLVVTAMKDVRIYRSIITNDHEVSGPDVAGVGGLSSNSDASHRFTFYEAARLPTHPALVRDVKWAPFNVRGFDLIATACKDGGVRIYELSVTESHDPRQHHHRTNTSSSNNINNNNSTTSSTTTNVPPLSRTHSNNYSQTLTRQSQQSSLTTAITTQARTNPSSSSTAQSQSNNNTNPNQQKDSSTSNQNLNTLSTQNPSARPQTTSSPSPSNTATRHHKFPYTTHVTPSATLLNAHTDAWTVSWDPSGQVLLSGGSDGSTKIWRRGILDAYYQNQNQGAKNTAEGVESGNGSGSGSGENGTGTGTGIGLAIESIPSTGGRWMLFADQAVELGGGGSEGSGMDYTDESEDEDEDGNDRTAGRRDRERGGSDGRE